MNTTSTSDSLIRPSDAGWVLGMVLLAALPLLLMSFGVELSSFGAPLAGPASDSSVDALFHGLRGPFTHTILEWTSFCAAVGVCVLALLRFRLTQDGSMLLIGIAFACAGSMDAFHTLAADRLTNAVADNTDLIPFTWALCRLFNAIIILAGVGLYLVSEGACQRGKRCAFMIPVSCVAFVLLAYGAISYCASSSDLPRTMYADAAIKRPYDLAALVPFLFGAIFVFPIYLRRNNTLFARALYLSLIPQIATQLYMILGSSELFDGAFNAAHFLKGVAYVTPCVGLLVEHAKAYGLAQEQVSMAEASSTRARAIMSAASDGIVVIDVEGRIESCNAATETIFGYGQDELIGENVSLLVADPHRDRHDGYLRRFARTGKSDLIGNPTEVVGQRKDGTLVPLRLSVNEALAPGGKLLVGLLHDLTAEKDLQVKLCQSQKLESIGQLAAGIAHEINTPTQYATDNVQFLGDAMGDLMALVESIRGIVGEPEETPEFTQDQAADLKERIAVADLEFLIDEIPKAIEQSLEGLGSVAHIVRAMKEFSHPGTDEKSQVDLNRTIESTVTVARNEWKYVADVVFELDPALPPVPCLQGEFNQVILNLVVNAAHAIEESRDVGPEGKGTITVSSGVDEDWVEIRIRDDGAGMPAEIKERIFDPFFTTKEVGRGTGQGLSIARSVIVDKHQGTLRVESELGQGTCFTIRLPLESEEEASLDQEDASDLETAA